MALPMHTCISSYFKNMQEKNWKLQLLEKWPSIAGNIQKNVWIQKINTSSITLGVTSSSWMHELYMLSHVLLQKINTNLDKPRIEKIYFKLLTNPQKKRYSFKKNKISTYNHMKQPVDLSYSQKNALKNIKDQQLASALCEFFYKCQLN